MGAGAHFFHLGIWEAEEIRNLYVWGQKSLHSEFQDTLEQDREALSQKTKTNNKQINQTLIIRFQMFILSVYFKYYLMLLHWK